MILNIKKEDKVVLSETKIIQKYEKDKGFRSLLKSYEMLKKDKGEWVEKATLTVLNAILNQQRVVFGITRSTLKTLLSSDKNWDKPLGLKASNYKKLIDFMVSNGIIESLTDTQDSKMSLYRVISSDICKYIKTKGSEQIKHSIKLVKGKEEKALSIKKEMEGVENSIDISVPPNWREKLVEAKVLSGAVLTESPLVFDEEYIKLLNPEKTEKESSKEVKDEILW